MSEPPNIVGFLEPVGFGGQSCILTNAQNPKTRISTINWRSPPFLSLGQCFLPHGRAMLRFLKGWLGKPWTPRRKRVIKWPPICMARFFDVKTTGLRSWAIPNAQWGWPDWAYAIDGRNPPSVPTSLGGRWLEIFKVVSRDHEDSFHPQGLSARFYQHLRKVGMLWCAQRIFFSIILLCSVAWPQLRSKWNNHTRVVFGRFTISPYVT